MGIRKPLALIALLLFLATLAYPAGKRDWKEGTLMSVKMIDVSPAVHQVGHAYECVVSDEVSLYKMEYDRPIKAAIRNRVKFVIEGDQFILLDADGKERPARIAKRDPVLLDSPGPRL
jgi:hypothetical protein